VVGFPLGASLATSKREEALALIKLGARELDMVTNLGLLKSGMSALVAQDIRGVVEVAHDAGAMVKVILETCLLSVEEKLRASELAVIAGADYLKTSTGFSTGGATAADVAILRGVAGSRCGVKASGGIRTLSDARAMLEAGATRIGASASVAILREYQNER
jgi:deoxyribose-phosphate aldolase